MAEAEHDRSALEAALAAAMRENGVHDGFRETLMRLVLEPGDEWRTCCGQDCDPCVLVFERVVDQVRASLKRGR